MTWLSWWQSGITPGHSGVGKGLDSVRMVWKRSKRLSAPESLWALCWASLVESAVLRTAQDCHTPPVWALQQYWKLAFCFTNQVLFPHGFLLAAVIACLVISSSRLTQKQQEHCSSLIKCWAYLHAFSFHAILKSANRCHEIFISLPSYGFHPH